MTMLNIPTMVVLKRYKPPHTLWGVIKGIEEKVEEAHNILVSTKAPQTLVKKVYELYMYI